MCSIGIIENTSNYKLKDLGFFSLLVDDSGRTVLFKTKEQLCMAFSSNEEYIGNINKEIEAIKSSLKQWRDKEFSIKDKEKYTKKLRKYFSKSHLKLSYTAREKEQQLLKLAMLIERLECINNIGGEIYEEVSDKIIKVIDSNKRDIIKTVIHNEIMNSVVENKNGRVRNKVERYYCSLYNGNDRIGEKVIALCTTGDEFNEYIKNIENIKKEIISLGGINESSIKSEEEREEENNHRAFGDSGILRDSRTGRIIRDNRERGDRAINENSMSDRNNMTNRLDREFTSKYNRISKSSKQLMDTTYSDSLVYIMRFIDKNN